MLPPNLQSDLVSANWVGLPITGAGLGLSLAVWIPEQHKRRIMLESASAQEATFASDYASLLETKPFHSPVPPSSKANRPLPEETSRNRVTKRAGFIFL
jgi:hypothetical protein